MWYSIVAVDFFFFVSADVFMSTQSVCTEQTALRIFIVAPCILIYVEFTPQQIHFLLI